MAFIKPYPKDFTKVPHHLCFHCPAIRARAHACPAPLMAHALTSCFVLCGGVVQWDKIVIDKGELTMRGFLDAFKAQTQLNVTLLFHKASDMDGPQKGRFLYNSEEYTPSNRALYASKLDTNLRDWVLERYAGAPVEIIGPFRKYLELETSAADDDGQVYITPTVIYRWQH